MSTVAALLVAVVASNAPASFALVVGSNRSADPELPVLRYADDDAVRYRELFTQLGARTYLLARLDENTARLYPEAAAIARPPTAEELAHAVEQLAADVRRAKESGLDTRLYFVFAGHGNVRDGSGYLTLEDRRLTGATLADEIVEPIQAGHTHVIVDACYSFVVAFGRGPGGERRPFGGFSAISALARAGRVGLLLSGSSARESHEWEGFQAGIFSYEVRSGLYGAADADADGQVTYPEIAAFVERANAAIPNERLRPTVFAWAPGADEPVVDLRQGLGGRLEVHGPRAPTTCSKTAAACVWSTFTTQGARRCGCCGRAPPVRCTCASWRPTASSWCRRPKARSS